jgi:hypothetical protein
MDDVPQLWHNDALIDAKYNPIQRRLSGKNA